MSSSEIAWISFPKVSKRSTSSIMSNNSKLLDADKPVYSYKEINVGTYIVYN